jgi:hypothetical protein
MNVNIYSEKFNTDLKEDIEQMIQNGCEKLDVKNFIEHCPLKTRIMRFINYVILSVVANFSIGFIYQEENKSRSKFYHLLRITSAFVFVSLGMLGIILPIIPGIPFLIIGIMLFYRQISLNKKKNIR